jgi:hypothetical protein
VSLLALLFIFAAVAAAGFVVARGVRRPAATDPEHPTCGQCGYIVHGIEGFTCPECGGDLREVGIIPPGGRRPMGTAARLAIWTGLALPAGIFLGTILAPRVAPLDLIATRRRVVFIQSPAISQAIHVAQHGRRRVLGRPRVYGQTPVPMQTMILDLRPGRSDTGILVDMRTGTGRFVDASGRATEGALDAELVIAWLNVHGLTGAAVPAHARDVLAAIAEMDNPPGRGGAAFSQFSPNPKRGRQPDVVAHPASPAFISPQNTRYTNAMPFALAGVVWLLGLPLVLRRRRSAARVESPRHADQT